MTGEACFYGERRGRQQRDGKEAGNRDCEAVGCAATIRYTSRSQYQFSEGATSASSSAVVAPILTAVRVTKLVMPGLCVRDKLISIIDDIELISKELFEMMLLPKPQRQGPTWEHTHAQIAELLVAKDEELKHYLQQAAEQEEIQKKTDSIRDEIAQQDEEIGQLQQHLRNAEQILATAIYQAKQKLVHIHRANEKSLSSEELIKYAHRISASHAVAAPYNWEVGDPRRPYPTDIEMRSGFLGQGFSDALLHPAVPPGPVMHQQQPPVLSHQQAAGPMDMNRQNGPGSSSQFQWNSDIKPNISAIQPLPPDQKAKDQSVEDVEVMSTDSSSSSSSDSQ